MTEVAYHGTDRMNFARFDIAEARICNIGLHFGTQSAAKTAPRFCAKELLEFNSRNREVRHDGG